MSLVFNHPHLTCILQITWCKTAPKDRSFKSLIYLCLDDNLLSFPHETSWNRREEASFWPDCWSIRVFETDTVSFLFVLSHKLLSRNRRVQRCPEMPHLRILKVSWANQTLCSALRWVSERWTAGMTGFHSNWIHEELLVIKHNLAGNNLTCPYI